MAKYSKHYLAGWKYAQAKAISAKGSFIWDDAAPKYLKKLGMEGWLDSDKYSLSDVAREHTRKAKEIAEEFEAGAKAGFDDWRDYKRYEGRYADRESGDPLIRTPNTGTSFTADEAQELAREFHGRENLDTTEFIVTTPMPRDIAQLGYLIELHVWVGDPPELGEKVKDGEYLPINFGPEFPNPNKPDTVTVGGVQKSGKRGQLYFVGGDQSFDLADFCNAAGLDYDARELQADSICLGPVKAIAYFADKHHLEGPKTQAKGIPYQHEFAINEQTMEVIGEWPELFYMPKEEQFYLAGGSYEILPEGISG